MSSKNPTISVRILDRDYQVACPHEQAEALLSAARYLDQQMRSIRNGGKVIGLERIAVMAALNISHELIEARKSSQAVSDDQAKTLERMSEKIEAVIAKTRQLELP